MRITSDTHEDFAGNRVTRYYREGSLVGHSVTRPSTATEQILGEEDYLTEVFDAQGNKVSTLRTREDNSIFAALGLASSQYVDVTDHRREGEDTPTPQKPSAPSAPSHLPSDLADQLRRVTHARATRGPNLKVWVPAVAIYLALSYFVAQWYGQSPDQGILGMLIGLIFLPGMVVLWILSLFFDL